MTTNLAADLRNRWRPTDTAVTLADAVLAASPGGTRVYTLHLLVDKSYAFWTEDVEVIGLDGVFTDRTTAWESLHTLARRYHEMTGRAVVGGYTIHNRPGHWAVFEDIGSEFPKEET